MALGVTQQLPINDKYSYSKTYLEAQICVLLAGRISEEIFLNTVTTGAGSDFDKTTAIARQMVCEWGMSSLGPIRLGQKDEMIFLGREMMYHNEYSEETARKIDQEVNNIIDTAYQRTKKTIQENREELETIAKNLLERESLSADDIDAILKGIELPPINHETKEETNTAKNEKENGDDNEKVTVDVKESEKPGMNEAAKSGVK